MTVVSKSSAYPATVQPGIPRLPDCPESWACKPLSAFLYEARRPIKMTDEGIYRLVKVKRARGGVVVRENLAGKNISVKSQFEIETGDFLISKRQIVHGACGLVPSELEGSIVSNEYSVLRGNDGISLDYLNYLAHSVYFQQTCFHSSIGVHVEKMIFKLDHWLSWDFLIPPIAEQIRIAQILSTWDQAIEVVEGLIKNSQAQKKALMQQLLTGKKRLPGLDGEWEEKYLGDVAEISSGFAFKSSDFIASDGIKVIRMSDLKAGTISTDNHAIVDKQTLNSLERFALSDGDFLFGMSGSLSNYAWVRKYDLPAYLNQRVGRLIAKENNHSLFIQYIYLSPLFQNKIAATAAGAAQLNISSRFVRKICFSIPTLEEQTAIATILSDADREIEIQQNQLTQLKSEKSALMQQLLTGKRRVKIDEEDTA